MQTRLICDCLANQAQVIKCESIRNDSTPAISTKVDGHESILLFEIKAG
jgi:hypothetical protein